MKEVWLWESSVGTGPNFIELLTADFVLTVWFPFHSAANRKHTKRHANLPVLMEINDVLNYTNPWCTRKWLPIIFMLTCEIPLRLSKLFCYSKHKDLLFVNQRFEIGPWSEMRGGGGVTRVHSARPNTSNQEKVPRSRSIRIILSESGYSVKPEFLWIIEEN